MKSLGAGWSGKASWRGGLKGFITDGGIETGQLGCLTITPDWVAEKQTWFWGLRSLRSRCQRMGCCPALITRAGPLVSMPISLFPSWGHPITLSTPEYLPNTPPANSHAGDSASNIYIWGTDIPCGTAGVGSRWQEGEPLRPGSRRTTCSLRRAVTEVLRGSGRRGSPGHRGRERRSKSTSCGVS